METKEQISSGIVGYLGSKPIIGGATVGGTTMLSFMELATPYIQFGGLCFGFIIGALTTYGLVLKYFFNKDNDKC